ncbi:hypothetical protein Tco_0685381 [Tanacetum coccineum]
MSISAVSPPFPLPPTSPAYDQAPLGYRAAMICIRDDIPKEDMPPRRRFILTAPPHGCDVAESYAAAAEPPRGNYIVEDVGYVRALQASEHRMMTSIEEVNLRVSYQAQAYLSSEARNRVLLARLETLETHMSRIEWQRQRAEDFAVRHMIRTHVLEARARIDMMEDAGKQSNDVMIQESIQAMIDQAIQRNSTHTQDDASQSLGGGLRRPVQPARVCSYTDFMKCQPLNFKGTEGVVGLGNDVAAYTQCFQELALMCTKFLADETKKVDKYISGLPDNIHGNVMSARPKTLDDAIELANDLIDQKLRTYEERQNDSKRKADYSSRNN